MHTYFFQIIPNVIVYILIFYTFANFCVHVNIDNPYVLKSTKLLYETKNKVGSLSSRSVGRE